MAWIKSHQELGAHPKVKHLARMLKISIPSAIGHLHLLWWWAMNYAQDGDLSYFDAEDIADAAGWTKKNATDFVDALVSCGIRGGGFLDKTEDGSLVIHDWDEHCGEDFEKRQKNAERLKKFRERKKEELNSANETDIDEIRGDAETLPTSAIDSNKAEENVTCNANETNVDVTCNANETDANVTCNADETRTKRVRNAYETRERRGEERKGEERKREEKEERKGEEKMATPAAADAAPPNAKAETHTAPLAKTKGNTQGKKAESLPSPIPPGPYDKQAFEVIQEMYWLCDGYNADAGAEVRLIQELAQEYPSVPLFQEFRKARDWLESHPEKGYKDLRRFLRNWISKAYNDYGKGKYYVEEAVFVPIDEPVGGKNYDAGKNQNAFGNSAGCGFAP